MNVDHVDSLLDKLKAESREIEEKKKEVLQEATRIGKAIKEASNTKKWLEIRTHRSDVSGGTIDDWYGIKRYSDGFNLSIYDKNGTVGGAVEFSNMDAMELRDYLISLNLGSLENPNFPESTESTELD